jgi:glycine/D-amino acid oxidase-like deaminating enzyme
MLDVLIIGGGIAGLWLLDDLRRAGYRVLLIEKDALGSGQTVASQGMLHSGLKHALAGRLGTYADALNGMTATWRACLSDAREPKLGRVSLRGQYTLCWRVGGIASAVTQLGARLGLRADVRRVVPGDRPMPLTGCPGDVLRLEEQVLDPSSLLETLAARNFPFLRSGTVRHASFDPTGNVRDIVVSDDDRLATMKARHVVLTAGAGNEDLRRAFGRSDGAMRRLPLPILVLEGDLPTLNGFCMNGTKAQVVVTTQRTHERHAVWQVACERAEGIPSDEFKAFAFRELQHALPGFGWPTVSTRMYLADRAEPVVSDHRSNDAYAALEGNVITAWPTKLVLAPRLTERIRALLPPPSGVADSSAGMDDWRRPPIARFPWL